MLAEFFKHTKSKIIISYILLFVLSLAAVIFIYRQITRAAGDDQGVSAANQKLFIIGNTITELYEAETLSNVFLQTGSENTFRKYIALMDQVEINIDSLSTLSNQAGQQLRLDTISILLDKKTKNLQSLIKTRESLTSKDFYSKAIASIESERNIPQGQKNVRQRMVTTVDSLYVKPEKKKRNFWSWLTKTKTDSSLQVKVSHHTITDTLNNLVKLQNTDTVVNLLKTLWDDIQEHDKNITREITRAEYNIISQSSNLTSQLRRILREYQQEELNNSFQKIEQREKIAGSTTRTIAWIAVVALLVILLFSFFILRDISRSQRYRRKLEAANQYADQLLRSREKLILTVTHDIKSPLSSVIGYTELLENTPVNDRQRYFLKNMRGSSQHILRLVTNLLDYSKLENNKMPVEEVVFNPDQLFREVCDSFTPMAASKNLTLECKIGEDLNSDCCGDALRIRQILANLLSNAVKYTQQGSISFTASTTTTDDKIILKIKDTGSGMTKDEQEIIFQEFTRLSSSPAAEGTGLGLTITHKLVQLLGGEISLESTSGQGSCFTVKLPLKRANKEQSAPQGQKKNKECPETTVENLTIPDHLRVLLVDDDPLQLAMTSALLQSRGIEADTTTDPDKVVELLQSASYGLLFSDIQMPRMDGFALMRKIRNSSLPFAKELRIVALSANAEKSEQDYIEAGFTAYLNKPFTPAQLFELLERLTRIKAGSPGNTEQPLKETEATQGFTLKNIRLFADNDEDAVQKIIRSFIRDTLQHLKSLQDYTAAGQFENIAKLAHKMLPIFRQLEAKSIIELLHTLEHQKILGVTEQKSRQLVGEACEKIEVLIRAIQ